MKTIIYHDDVDGITAAWAVLANPVAMGWFQCADGSISCSLRGNGHVDVSYAARKMGGGGHPNAAGFALPNLAALEAL